MISRNGSCPEAFEQSGCEPWATPAFGLRRVCRLARRRSQESPAPTMIPSRWTEIFDSPLSSLGRLLLRYSSELTQPLGEAVRSDQSVRHVGSCAWLDIRDRQDRLRASM